MDYFAAFLTKEVHVTRPFASPISPAYPSLWERGEMQTARQTPAGMTDDEVMMTAAATCRFFGGPERPIHIATLYRGIAAGRYPPPVMIGPNSARWLLSECRKARQKAIDARAGTLDPGEEPSKPRARGARKREAPRDGEAA